MEIRKVKDIEEFLYYIRIKNNSMEEKMWSETQLTQESFDTLYHHYDAYLVTIDQQIIGGYLLLENDYSYWNEKDNQDHAYYIHKLFILAPYNKKGYSRQIIDHIKNIAQTQNKDYLRLDCRYQNIKLNQLYDKLGFKIVRKFNSPVSGKMNLREYQLSSSR